MKTKSTIISSTDRHLSISILVYEDGKPTTESYSIEFPFCAIPPQVAHQIASQIALCNSYYVDEYETK